MEFLFFSVQMFLIVSGALVVVFARNIQIGFGGFSCILMALSGFFIYSSHPFGPYLFHLTACFTVGGFIYYKQARIFEQKRPRPLDTHLGVSRLIAILTTFYFLGSILPFWPSELRGHTLLKLKYTLNPELTGWLGGATLAALVCTLAIIPLFKKGATE